MSFRVFLQYFFYGLLGLLLVGTSLSFVLAIFFDSYTVIWQYYTVGYAILLVAYSWYSLAMLAIAEYKKKKWQPLNEDIRFSVIIPCYNEDEELLTRAVMSVIRAKGNKEVIIVNDGSTNNTRELFDQLAGIPGLIVHNFEKNLGKRAGLHYAVTNLVSDDSQYVVTLDSDTIIEEDTLLQVLAPMSQPNVHASTGEVKLLNEKQNILTRMVGAYYWVGLHVYKEAQSGLGIVVCCSGCLAAYRTDTLRGIIDEFYAQTFFGKPATHSEDRHLTNLILRSGGKVVYVPEAVAYTETPSKLNAFLRQQLRWKRGFVRESLYTLSYAWKNQKRLFLQILAWDLTSTYLSFGLRLNLLFLAVFNPLAIVFIAIPVWALAVVLRYGLVIFRAPQKTFGLFVYALLFEFILYWVNIYAFFTASNRKWITRTDVKGGLA